MHVSYAQFSCKTWPAFSALTTSSIALDECHCGTLLCWRRFNRGDLALVWTIDRRVLHGHLILRSPLAAVKPANGDLMTCAGGRCETSWIDFFTAQACALHHWVRRSPWSVLYPGSRRFLLQSSQLHGPGTEPCRCWLMGFSMTDQEFAEIVTKPDNVPIVAMVFLLGFFTWLAYEPGDPRTTIAKNKGWSPWRRKTARRYWCGLIWSTPK